MPIEIAFSSVIHRHAYYAVKHNSEYIYCLRSLIKYECDKRIWGNAMVITFLKERICIELLYILNRCVVLVLSMYVGLSTCYLFE